MKTLRIHLQSECPLIMHNGRLANPRNAITKELRTYTSKRNQTEDDWDRIAEIEFAGSLYFNKEGEPCIPALNIAAALIKAGGKSRKGQALKAGMRILNDMVLEYDGPRDAESLWNDERFVFTTMVGIERRRTPRTRPIFDEWKGNFDILFNPEIVDQKQLNSFIEFAGQYYGLCDWRPQFGRFVVTAVEIL